MLNLSFLLKLLDRWKHRQRVSDAMPDLPYSVLKLKYQDRSYRAETNPGYISIQRLHEGDCMDFSTDQNAEHASIARNALNGDDWGFS